jgi:hypothetical protein
MDLARPKTRNASPSRVASAMISSVQDSVHPKASLIDQVEAKNTTCANQFQSTIFHLETSNASLKKGASRSQSGADQSQVVRIKFASLNHSSHNHASHANPSYEGKSQREVQGLRTAPTHQTKDYGKNRSHGSTRDLP